MHTYIITAHIEFPSKTQPIQTGHIRMEIPAESEDEARIKAMKFITSKTKVVIEKCENKKNKEWMDSMMDMLKGSGSKSDLSGFGDIFK
ncbi:hypothetical protein MUN82_08880 [Hymenobacter aerilatus]|uniref:Uncharacterized protein n=1 Tax=Hymenobacter aerilatus TaxID=2932251 RepID=A0A8T9T005_9BACT|nr:hypothetical protein [Hymenobacter aerilatus]UOR07197.1 hypothetical protein MUN82_08880 [Hymenobacter aerilatus]